MVDSFEESGRLPREEQDVCEGLEHSKKVMVRDAAAHAAEVVDDLENGAGIHLALADLRDIRRVLVVVRVEPAVEVAKFVVVCFLADLAAAARQMALGEVACGRAHQNFYGDPLFLPSNSKRRG